MAQGKVFMTGREHSPGIAWDNVWHIRSRGGGGFTAHLDQGQNLLARQSRRESNRDGIGLRGIGCWAFRVIRGG